MTRILGHNIEDKLSFSYFVPSRDSLDYTILKTHCLVNWFWKAGCWEKSSNWAPFDGIVHRTVMFWYESISSTYPCQSVGQWVRDSFWCGAIASSILFHTEASPAPSSSICPSVRQSRTLSDFHSVTVWPSRSVRRPWDDIYFLKAMTNSFQIWVTEHLMYKRMFSFRHCPNYLRGFPLKLSEFIWDALKADDISGGAFDNKD